MVEIVRQRGLTTQERGEILFENLVKKYVDDGANDLDKFQRLISFGEHLMTRSEGVTRRVQGVPLARIPQVLRVDNPLLL